MFIEEKERQYAYFDEEEGPLMFITNHNGKYTEEQQICMAMDGGCDWIQLRMKERLTLDVAKKLVKMALLKNMNTRICINDDLEIAIQSEANTVHLGKNDMSVSDAWRIIYQCSLGDDFLVGATANTFEDIVEADRQGASYIGLGPYRFTETKKNLSPILGVEGYERIMDQCRDAGIEIPVFAIGGIQYEDIGPLMTTGITGIAVSSAITQAKDPVNEIKRFRAKISKYRKKYSIDR